jgi:hypothetical protein
VSPVRLLTIALLTTAGACSWQSAVAADLVLDPGVVVDPNAQLPAVSGINGKWEFDPGLLTGGGLIRGAGSLTVPLGDRFGVQGDMMASWTSTNGFVYSGALHAFTRDPDRYLAGLTGGIVVTQQSRLGVIGPEAELYFDRFSLEGWAGIAGLDYIDPAMVDKFGVFAMGDFAYYPQDNFELKAGGSYVLGDFSLHAGAEYQLQGLGAPVSLVGDARYHANGSYTFTAGIKGYFGGDPAKPLILRHRQDDPPDRAIDLFTAAGSQIFATAPGAGPTVDPEQAACEALSVSAPSGWTATWDPEASFDGECIVSDGESSQSVDPFTFDWDDLI